MPIVAIRDLKPQPQSGGKTEPRARKRPDQPEPAPSGGEQSYTVGYCKPPVEHQFKPGGKGGPGRPPKSRNLRTLVREAMLEKVPIRVEGRTKMVSRIEALVLKNVELAFKGNQKATQWLLRSYEAAAGLDETNENSPRSATLTDADEAILKLYEQQIIGQMRDEGHATVQ